ncbi:MAG: hypothetical protein ACE367_20990 [Acidimicrobiales bacterium]
MLEIVLAGCVAVLAVAVVVLVAQRRASPDARTTVPSNRTDEVDPSDVATDDGVETRRNGDAIELWWPGGTKLATLRLGQAATTGASLPAPWARGAVTSLVRRARRGSGDSGAGRYRITIPPDLATTIREGGELDVVLGAGANLSMLGRGAGAVVAPTAAALTVGTLALGIAQQQRLDRTLAVIDRRLGLVVDRLRDDDHGRLDAAEALLELVDGRDAEVPGSQLRTELAVARQDVEAVYFARRRYAERLAAAIGDAQLAEEADSGEARAWADGVLDAVADPAELRSELFVYLRALVVRARLATTTSTIIALDGDGPDAARLLSDTVEELRRDFYAVYRRLRPLAHWAPARGRSLRRRDWERAHETVREVFALMAGEIEPLLPPADGLAVELDVVVGEDGVVTDASVVVADETDTNRAPGALVSGPEAARAPGSPPTGAAAPPTVARSGPPA